MNSNGFGGSFNAGFGNTFNSSLFGAGFNSGSGNMFNTGLGGAFTAGIGTGNLSGFRLGESYGEYNKRKSSDSSSGFELGESYEEYKKRKAKENEEKELRRKEARIKAEKEEMEKPLTEGETEKLRKEALVLDKKNNKEAEGSLKSAMLFPALSSIPVINKGMRAKSAKNTIEMFYYNGDKPVKHLPMFYDNPELMTNAQETMQKLERKYIRDIRYLKGNEREIIKLEQERELLRDVMRKALEKNDAEEIAIATAKCQTAAGVKNGWFKRTLRGFRSQPKFVNRYDAFEKADKMNQFASAKVPENGKSFLKNMFSSKLSTVMAASMIVLPFITDWGNIKQARAVDKENKENGTKTHHGRKQIIQTSIKGATSFVCYNVVDTAVRTGAKRLLGTFAKRFVARLAVKGGCKALGAIVGSVAPGIGNLLGIAIGAGLDLVLNTCVFGNMKFFNNSGAKEAQIEKSSGEELLTIYDG